MVLSTANSGKYLSKKWQEDRANALIDRSRFTDAELDWLEVGATEGIVSADRTDIYQVQTQPIDPLTRSRNVDIREVTGRE